MTTGQDPIALQEDEQEQESDPWSGQVVLLLTEAIAQFDLIERSYTLLQWLRGIKSHRFAITRFDPDWPGIAVERLLLRHGVRLWDRSFDSERLLFLVKKGQARFAEYLMLRCGVQLECPLLDPRHANVLPGPEPMAQGPPLKPGLIMRILGVFLG